MVRSRWWENAFQAKRKTCKSLEDRRMEALQKKLCMMKVLKGGEFKEIGRGMKSWVLRMMKSPQSPSFPSFLQQLLCHLHNV